MDLSDLQTQIDNDSDRYFPDVDVTYLYLACALAGEAGEICNKWKKFYRTGEDNKRLLQEIKQELPDVLIYLCMMASHLDCDLMEEYEVKREHNDRKYCRTDREA
jgi:NTP pyrophosphatase (non-canonical NTP hydrolase)